MSDSHEKPADKLPAPVLATTELLVSGTPPATKPAAYGYILQQDVPCRRCGYNLRGLHNEGTCPECSTPVSRTLLGDRLRFSSPGWIRTLKWGLVLLLLDAGGGTLWEMISMLPDLHAHRIALAIAAMSFNIVGVAGMWLLSTPEPQTFEHKDTRTLRRATRALGLAALTGRAIMTVAVLNHLDALRPVGLALWLLEGVMFWLMLMYLARLARRIPNESWASQLESLRWGLTLGFAFSNGPFLVVGSLGSLSVCLCLPTLTLAISGIWYLVILIRLHSAFTAAARAARINAQTA